MYPALLILIFAAFFLSTFAEDLTFAKVHLVEYNSSTNNFFFRGDLPVVNGHFAYNELHSYFLNRAQERNISFPKKYHLIDISLLWAIEEIITDYYIELDFWKDQKNQEFGEFLDFSIGFSGFVIRPTMMPLSFAKKYASKFANIDDLYDKVQYVRNIMSTKLNESQVIYAHCHHGCDRTGLLVGSYRMFYYGMNIESAYDLNIKECGRTQDAESTESLKWFCLDLGEKMSKDFGDCLGFADCPWFPFSYCKKNYSDI